MRPDEHKKKKNAQYKKKHGISEKENKIKDDSKSKTSVQDQKAKPTSVKGAESKELAPSEKNKVKLEETEDVSKHYGKRKIVSNWSRYEDDSESDVEDDLPLQRGEDFNKLLAQAGGSATQFRLKDEEDWNVEGSDTSPVLALDIDSLSQSLDCIPLHERLGVTANVFTEEQMKEMKTYSADVEQKYLSTNSMNNSKKAGHESQSTLTSNPSSSAIENNVNIKTKGKTTWNSPVTHVKEKPESPSVNETNRSKNESKKPIRNIEVESLEDDLDMILSLDGTKNKEAVIGKKVEKVAKKDRQKDQGKENSDRAKVSKITIEKENNSKGNENLEDWLDSMLDD